MCRCTDVETDTDFDVKTQNLKIYRSLVSEDAEMEYSGEATEEASERYRRTKGARGREREGWGGQRYSAADRNIRRYLRIPRRGRRGRRVRWQDIGTGEPTTPRYIEGTKHRGSGRRTRIEILLSNIAVSSSASPTFTGPRESRGLHVGNRMDLRAVGRLP